MKPGSGDFVGKGMGPVEVRGFYRPTIAAIEPKTFSGQSGDEDSWNDGT
jgi:hypothetical protein